MMLIPNNTTQMHMQQITKKFLSLHFTHDIIGLEKFYRKKLSYPSAGIVQI